MIVIRMRVQHFIDFFVYRMWFGSFRCHIDELLQFKLKCETHEIFDRKVFGDSLLSFEKAFLCG